MSNGFGPGRRNRVEGWSSNVPTDAGNRNSVGAQDQCDAVTATQRVFHDILFPSAVTLPLASEPSTSCGVLKRDRR